MALELKTLVKTKTFWVGLITIAAGVVEGVFDGAWNDALTKILIGLGMITGRQAIEKLST